MNSYVADVERNPRSPVRTFHFMISEIITAVFADSFPARLFNFKIDVWAVCTPAIELYNTKRLMS